jgi:hypothetical protein
MHYRNKLLGLALTGFGIVAVAFGYYRYKFGPNVLVDHEKWGQFGDFLGGTTNPLLAFLTFLGVLWTISLTHDERKEQKIESEKNDLYRIIETIFRQTNELVSAKILKQEVVLNRVFLSEEYLSFADLLNMKKNKPNWEALKEVHSGHLLNIASSLTTLKHYISEYERLADNRAVGDYYRIFYIMACFQLNELGFLNKDELAFFSDPKNKLILGDIINSGE